MWVHPAVSVHGKTSLSGIEENPDMLQHTIQGQTWSFSTPACRSSGSPKILRLAWGSLQTPQQSQTLGEPKVSFLTSTDVEGSSF